MALVAMIPLPKQTPLHTSSVFSDGYRAGEWMRKRGFKKSALLRGRFDPAFAFADHGTFRVLCGSLIEHEARLLHADVPEYWRGFVEGFDADV